MASGHEMRFTSHKTSHQSISIGIDIDIDIDIEFSTILSNDSKGKAIHLNQTYDRSKAE